jgi:hypothetical protein
VVEEGKSGESRKCFISVIYFSCHFIYSISNNGFILVYFRTFQVAASLVKDHCKMRRK